MFMWKRTRLPAARPSMGTPCSPWHAVSIVSSTACCPEAMALMGTRFLSREALQLPLMNCSMSAECRCWYRHHDDRRSLSRRSQDPWSPALANYRGEERRHNRGRRATDRP
jgi:hypothetical protein